MSLRIALLLLLPLACLIGSIPASARAAAEPKVQAVRVPDGGIHPQAQTDSRGRVHLIYFKGDPRRGDIFYVRSDDGGTTFTPAIRVNSQAESAIIAGTIRGPHIAIGKGDRPHVAWMGSDKAAPKVAGKHVPMMYTRMNDAGDAFKPQRNVIRNHPGLDGGGSVAADRQGNVYVAWHAPEKGDAHGHDEEDRQVWVTRSRDDGMTFEPETAAIPKKAGVCACCGLNLTASDGGRVVIAFRSATATVNRDMHILMSKDFAKTFKIAAVDRWTVGKCVMSTAAFAQRGRDVLAAWETKEQVQFAVFSDAAKSSETLPMPGNAKARKHPSVAANGAGEYVVAWTEGTGWNKGGAVVWQAFDPQGQPIKGQAGRIDGLQPWSVPSVYAAPDGSFKVMY